MTPPMATEREEKKPPLKRYPAPPCPRCQSDNTIVRKTYLVIRRYRCLACDHRWAGVRR